MRKGRTQKNAMIKLIYVYSDAHETYKNQWFLPSLKDDLRLEEHYAQMPGGDIYMEEDWAQGVVFKSETIINAIKANRGRTFIYSDVDIQFFKPIKDILLEAIGDKDIVCQRDDPRGQLCTGFFVMRSNDKMLKLWEDVHAAAKKERRDQLAFNRLIKVYSDIRYGYLPQTFFGGGTFFKKIWKPGRPLYIPLGAIMHHANWAIGQDHKSKQLEYVRRVVRCGPIIIFFNNLCFIPYKCIFLFIEPAKAFIRKALRKVNNVIQFRKI